MKRPHVYQYIREGLWQFRDGSGPVVVMAVSGGWVMARRPQCVPAVFWAAEWEEKFERRSGE